MKSLIWINPAVGFGRPCVRGTGLHTDVIFARWLAGEHFVLIASDYGIGHWEVIAAIHFELGRSRSRSQAAREALSP